MSFFRNSDPVLLTTSAFSRIELLILLLIGAIAASIAVPLVLSAREAARRELCKGHLHQIGLALGNYHDVYASFPPGCVGAPKLVPSRRWSWYLAVRPLLEGGIPPLPIDLAKPSDERASLPSVYEYFDKEHHRRTARFGDFAPICPNGEGETDRWGQRLATYVGMAGLGKDAATLPAHQNGTGLWGYDRVTATSSLGARAESTIHVIETAADRGSWYRGGPATVRPFVEHGGTAVGDGGQFGGLHPNGAMTLFADGHVTFLSSETDVAFFKSMATIADD